MNYVPEAAKIEQAVRILAEELERALREAESVTYPADENRV